LTGLPFPSLVDAKVKLKRSHLDGQSKIIRTKPKLLNPVPGIATTVTIAPTTINNYNNFNNNNNNNNNNTNNIYPNLALNRSIQNSAVVQGVYQIKTISGDDWYILVIFLFFFSFS
jgi:hypothetical protein